MADQSKKKPSHFDREILDDVDMNDRLERDRADRTLREAKRIRRVNPLGPRVLVRIIKDSNMTDAGLYLPEGSKESMQESVLAEVIEVASAIDEDTHEEANVSGIPFGAIVLIPKQAGTKVPWDADLRIVETKYILGTVDEVNLV